jgi:hypothetical protein
MFVRYRNKLQQICQLGYQELQFNWDIDFKIGVKKLAYFSLGIGQVI